MKRSTHGVAVRLARAAALLSAFGLLLSILLAACNNGNGGGPAY